MIDPVQPLCLQTADFVNRLKELDDLVKIARRESPYSLYLVQGPEGIGKSYLLKEFQAQCRVAGIPCARVLPGMAQDTNYMSIVETIWVDLDQGTSAELYKQIALARAARIVQTVPLPNLQPGEVALAFPGDPTIFGNINTGQVENMTYSLVMEMLSNDHEKARQDVKEVITPFLKDFLVRFCANKRTVFLVDPWEAACRDDQTRDWLIKTLVDWILDGEVPNAGLAIAGSQLPQLTRLLSLIYQTELGYLDDAAICTYWVDKCILPAEDLPEVIQITNGIPQALSLTASRASITGHLAPGSYSASQEPGDITGYALEGLLAVMPAELVCAIRLCAIPHWFHNDLFFALADPPGWSQDLFEQLVGLRIIERDPEGFFRYSDSVRTCLLADWWRREKRPEYEEKSKVILAYLQGPGRQASSKQLWSLEQEIIYFTLIVDEARGIQLLCDRFEMAERQHELGLAEQYTRKAQELDLYISTRGQQWLGYFVARVNLFKGQTAEALDALETLAGETEDLALHAAIMWVRARVLVDQQQWSKSTRLISDALKLLNKQPFPLYEMLVRLSLAEVYRDLAQNCGNIHPESSRIDGRSGGWLSSLQHLPFLAFESLVHHWSFLPNWYFGTNYQDWIMSHLLMESAHWYRKAEGSLEEGMVPLWRFDLQVGLAWAEHQLGRWSKVKKRYAELEELDLVKISAYRKALVSTGNGQALAEEGKFEAATARLEAALPVLDHFKDWEEAGTARASLSQVYRALGKIDESAAIGIKSITNFRDAGDPIQATQMICFLEDLTQDAGLREQAVAVRSEVESDAPRQYLARFPDALLRWFKRAAVLGALPLTYLLFLILSILAAVAIAWIEGEIGLFQADVSDVKSLLDGILILGFILLPIPLTLWSYRFIYWLIGLVTVFYLGRRLAPIEEEQPRQFIIGSESIQYTEKSGGELQEIRWNEIQQVGIDSYRLWQHEINLVSRTILVPRESGRPPVEIDGITTGYDHLKGDLLRRVQASGAAVETLSLDFQLFNWRWGAGSVLASLVLLGFMIMTHRICGSYEVIGSGQGIETFVGPLAAVLLPTIALVLPVQISWRSLFHSRQVARKLDRKPKTFAVWQSWLAAIFTTMILLLWLLKALSVTC